MAEYTIIIERAEGNYSAYCPDLPGCIATGSTIEKTIQRMKEAIIFHHSKKKTDTKSFRIRKSIRKRSKE